MMRPGCTAPRVHAHTLSPSLFFLSSLLSSFHLTQKRQNMHPHNSTYSMGMTNSSSEYTRQKLKIGSNFCLIFYNIYPENRARGIKENVKARQLAKAGWPGTQLIHCFSDPVKNKML